ncbi:phosphoenolpyruvate carboxykinase [Rhodobacteraceae bacterium RKSG542]|uniref:phosphoenolpyruvate carboxykinase n=1 Tax=Pseudovibrio flavus TaxID=2529854 RepID=UPI0012BB5359|nr:phosphoenolpyruvate carboxykinase [Pseudovibrio flavus]MTI17813.1 phosphoenolpyruvate carboxykinase [Pseudovibrio flavus]
MAEFGTRNSVAGSEIFGFSGINNLYWNMKAPELYEYSLCKGEANIAAGGALVVDTGEHTGRSPKDKFIVKDATTENSVWWDNSAAMTPEQFALLKEDMIKHAEGMELYAQDLYGGADASSQLPVRVFTEYAWHSLFIRNLLRRPEEKELLNFVPEMTIVDLPSFKADPARHGSRSQTIIACDFTNKVVLIAGTSYAGEMKKSVFSMLNFLLPEQGIMPMHCSANNGDSDDAAVFFGLSGTGKTTLSADASRTLVGDDEHGWGPNGIFNFEGGCYAKTINLSREAEPEIFSTTERFGTILENVVLDSNRVPNFNDGSKTENTRCAYPIDFIPNASEAGRAGHPKNIIMLTADAFGVLPPIAKLTGAQAMYHFLSGYTAKVAGTEKGVTEPQATFSTCFGAPFMPRHPSEYGALLKDLIAKHDVDCWLVNTGWTSGPYGVGHRMPIKETRALLTAALNGTLKNGAFRKDANFGFDVPVLVAGVDTAILDPRGTWEDPLAYDAQAAKLVEMFTNNFRRFEEHVGNEVMDAAPEIYSAAE